MALDIKGKVRLITGATSGAGKATARDLAKMGAIVIGVGGDCIKCAEVISEIRNSSGNPSVEFLVADLSNQDQIRQLVRGFESSFERLDVLIDNAGAFFLRRKLSRQGIEMTWALYQSPRR